MCKTGVVEPYAYYTALEGTSGAVQATLRTKWVPGLQWETGKKARTHGGGGRGKGLGPTSLPRDLPPFPHASPASRIPLDMLSWGLRCADVVGRA